MYRVFVVDDEPLLLSMLNTVLKSRYEVYTFSSPEKALGAIEEMSPDVVLVDLAMPEMSGDELIRRANDGITQFIIITGSYTEDTECYVEAGALWVINKPLNMPKFLSRVERACRFSSGLRKLAKSGRISGDLRKATESLLVDLDNLIGSMKDVPVSPARSEAGVT